MSQISIIIRAKNEEYYLPRVLQKLKEQTYQDFEIILIDNESTDKTIEIAKNYHCKILNIQKGDFTYPYACNYGIKNSSGKYIVFLSGHSIPISETWLEDGVENFRDEKVAGVYGTILALPESKLYERLFSKYFRQWYFNKRWEITEREDVNIGVLGFTNAIIRRDLWEEYNLNEKYAAGGEDGDWARHWVKEGYKIIHDPRFRVQHSHNLGAIAKIQQIIGWAKMAGPQKFKPQKRNF